MAEGYYNAAHFPKGSWQRDAVERGYKSFKVEPSSFEEIVARVEEVETAKKLETQQRAQEEVQQQEDASVEASKGVHTGVAAGVGQYAVVHYRSELTAA
jgi:hypothetical protein